MNGQNTAELPIMEDQNYTYVSSTTLEMVFPDEVISSDDIIREHPSHPLRKRTPEEITRLRNHFFFAEK